MQNVVVGQEIDSRLGFLEELSILVAACHVPPFQVAALPSRSTATQKEVVGQEMDLMAFVVEPTSPVGLGAFQACAADALVGADNIGIVAAPKNIKSDADNRSSVRHFTFACLCNI